MKDLTWTCHICKEERPDHLISVYTKPLKVAGMVCGEMNVRYCNDKESCIAAATKYTFGGWE